MKKPLIPCKKYFVINVIANQEYAWCSCGKSKEQPFCDGSHNGSSFKPLIYKAIEDRAYYFCGCKHTKSPPRCDGQHSLL